MLKTNSKKAIENIRKYICENVDVSSYDQYSYVYDLERENKLGTRNIDMFSVYAHVILECAYNEKIKNDKSNMSTQELFIEWLQGLPTIFDSRYYYNRSAIDDLGAILEQTEEEKRKYEEIEAENLLSHLIYREIRKAAEWYE